MKNHAYYSLFYFLFLLAASCAQKEPVVTIFILIRHAEKGDDGTEDPDLRPEGEARAKTLASMLGDTPIDAIYSTAFKRTKNTVRLLAQNKNLKVQTYQTFNPEVIENMVEQYAGGTVLISGHSNNIPWTANLLIGEERFKDYADSEYDIMLIVSVVEKGKVAKVVRLHY